MEKTDACFGRKKFNNKTEMKINSERSDHSTEYKQLFTSLSYEPK